MSKTVKFFATFAFFAAKTKNNGSSEFIFLSGMLFH